MMLTLHLIQLAYAVWCLIGFGILLEMIDNGRDTDLSAETVAVTLLVGAVIALLSFALGVS